MGSHRTMVIKHSPVVVEGKKGTKLNNFHITRQISEDMSRLTYRFARYLFVMLVCSGTGWIIDFVAGRKIVKWVVFKRIKRVISYVF